MDISKTIDTIELAQLLFTGVGFLLTFATLIFGILKFSEERRREFQKAFFSAQLEIYKQAVHHASAIYLHPKSSAQYQSHRSEYKNLFLGKMCIVEDRMVEQRMVQFNTILDWYDHSTDALELKVLKNEIWYFSLVLAHTMRNSSVKTWKVEDDVLGELFNDYSKTPREDKLRIEVLRQMILGKIQPESYPAKLNARLIELKKTHSNKK